MKIHFDPLEDDLDVVAEIIGVFRRKKQGKGVQSSLPSDDGGGKKKESYSDKPESMSSGPSPLATDKQKGLMRKLHIDFDEGITLEEASRRISAKIDGK